MKHPTLAALSLVALLGAIVAPLDATAAEPLLIGVAARISPRESYAYYDRLLAYVGRKLGRQVEMVQFSTYDEMDTALERRDLDYAFICAGPYVRDPAASPATTLADLRGKQFAFTDAKSNTGRLVPAYLVQREFGVRPESWFSSVRYLGSHDASIDAVNAGTVDGASVDSLIFDYVAARHPGRVKNVRILVKSPPFGIPPVVANRRADPAVRQRVRDALLSMHSDPEGRRILDGIMVDRFIVPVDSDYNAVREMESWLAEQARAR